MYNIGQLQTKISEKLHVSSSQQKFSNWSSRQYNENVCVFHFLFGYTFNLLLNTNNYDLLNILDDLKRS